MKFWNFLFKQNKTNVLQNDNANRKIIDDKLRRQLILMVDGDWKKADALIARARFCDPGRSDNYYCYKAIVHWKRSNNIN